MKNRKLGPFQVSEIGLGCMNLSHAYGAPVSEAQAEKVLLTALDAGVTFLTLRHFTVLAPTKLWSAKCSNRIARKSSWLANVA